MNWAVSGQSSDGRAWVGCLSSGADFGSRSDEFGTELVCGDDAVVENGNDVWLGGQEAQGSCVVLLAGGRLDDGYAQVLVPLGEASACGADVGFCIAGDGGVAIEDKVAVGNVAGSVDLGRGNCGEYEGQKEDGLQVTEVECAGERTVDIRHGLDRFAEREHGCTSLLH